MNQDSIFSEEINVEYVNEMCKGCMVSYVGIEFTEIGADYLKAKMPVDERTKQPMGLLHGGASVVLAETMGSVASLLALDASKQYSVGLDINANHIRSATEGYVYGITKPIHLGKTTQVWGIEITNEAGKMVCVSRLTMAVLDKKN